jgi:putative transcriptional regulator
MESMLKIANRLRVLRAERNITQEELAAAVGVTRVTISCIERGEYRPSIELVFRLARFFGTAVEDVFFVEEPR